MFDVSHTMDLSFILQDPSKILAGKHVSTKKVFRVLKPNLSMCCLYNTFMIGDSCALYNMTCTLYGDDISYSVVRSHILCSIEL